VTKKEAIAVANAKVKLNRYNSICWRIQIYSDETKAWSEGGPQSPSVAQARAKREKVYIAAILRGVDHDEAESLADCIEPGERWESRVP